MRGGGTSDRWPTWSVTFEIAGLVCNTASRAGLSGMGFVIPGIHDMTPRGWRMAGCRYRRGLCDGVRVNMAVEGGLKVPAV